MTVFHVSKAKQGYAVFDGKKRISGFYIQMERALVRLDSIRSSEDIKPASSTRNCMCCRQKFRSEGIHNRLCSDCRKKSGGYL